ncbi:MAG: SprB repeat-containing protein, partial [Algoriphagus sp.]|nr:SprB repeat-containing protein [Algoriphagus sp.]
NLSVQGGEAPYSYLWSNGSTSKDLVGVSAGIYQVQIKDSKGCSFQGSYTINPPSSIQLGESLTMPSCGQTSNGQIKLTVAGGTAPFTYQWSNGSTQSQLENLSAGTYSVKVTDASGCSVEKQYTLNNLSALNLASFQKQDVTCFGDNSGKIDLNISGAMGAIQATWSDGSTSINRNNLAPGTYSVVIKDQHCEISANFQILGPTEALSATASTQNPSCSGNDGKITLNPKGGTAPYTYKWSNGGFTKDLSGLGQGKYTVDITDKNGCKFQASFDLVSPMPITIEDTLKDPSCVGNSDGSISLKITGGNAPYTYAWSNGSTQSSLQNLAAGTYKVKITDATGCSVEKEYAVKNLSALTLSSFQKQDVTCFGINTGKIELTLAGATGTYKSNGQTVPHRVIEAILRQALIPSS